MIRKGILPTLGTYLPTKHTVTSAELAIIYLSSHAVLHPDLLIKTDKTRTT
jgi:hypothetical protein